MDHSQFSSMPYYRQFVQQCHVTDIPDPPPYPGNLSPMDLTRSRNEGIKTPCSHGENFAVPPAYPAPAYYRQEITLKQIACYNQYFSWPQPCMESPPPMMHKPLQSTSNTTVKSEHKPANNLRFAIYEGILSSYTAKSNSSPDCLYYNKQCGALDDDVGYSSVSDLSSADTSATSIDNVSSAEPSLMELLDNVTDSSLYFKDITCDLDNRNETKDVPMLLREPRKQTFRNAPLLVITKPNKMAVSKDLNFPCDICHVSFSSSAQLRSHMSTIHSNARRHVCTVCQKAFSQKTTLRTHMRVHTGERPFQCRMCPKAFADYSTCCKHERTHTGERPYTCPICGRGFAQSGNMIRHKQTHNKPKKAKKA